jgi:C4-dicarboxylate transporter, DctQ subunit
MKIVKMITFIIGEILKVAGIIAGILIFLIAAMVLISVAGRNIMLPIHWVEPFSVYFFIAASYISAAFAMYNAEHIKIDILTNQFSSKTNKVIEIFLMTGSLVFFIFLTKHSWVMMHSSFVKHAKDLSIIQVPIWIPQSSLVIGSVLLCLAIIRHVLLIFLKDHQDAENETPVLS